MTFISPGEDAQLIAQLWMQREVLARVGAEIADRLRGLPAPSDGSWRSDAERAYARALDEVDDMLRTAWSALDVAVDEIDSDLGALAVGAG